jgi:hypothetical protein
MGAFTWGIHGYAFGAPVPLARKRAGRPFPLIRQTSESLETLG